MFCMLFLPINSVRDVLLVQDFSSLRVTCLHVRRCLCMCVAIEIDARGQFLLSFPGAVHLVALQVSAFLALRLQASTAMPKMDCMGVVD